MTVTAQVRLDDPALLRAGDPGDMLRQVASAAAQVRTAVQAAEEADLSAVLGGGRPRAVIVTGMGGSGVAGEVLAAVCGPGCPAQILTVHDYHLPAWVGAADLVLAVSCSGQTEETLSSAADAVRRGCRLIGVGGRDSALAELTQQARAPFVPVRSAGMPRSTLWGLSVPLVAIAARMGILAEPGEAYEAAAAELERVSQMCRPDNEAFVNPGKTLALELSGALPVIWGTSHLAGVAAQRFASQLNENGKYPAVAGVLPEANHNQVVAFDGTFAPGPAARGEAGGPGVPLRLVLVRDSREHPQVARRREESAALASERGVGVSELSASGDHPLERLASLIQVVDYASVYFALAHGTDPSPIAVIGELKDRIA